MKHSSLVKNKLYWILVLACALLTAALPAMSAAHAADDAASIIDGVITHARGERSLQAWVDNILAPEVNGSADHYIFALSRLGVDFDSAAYARALREALEEGKLSNPSSRMRAMLTLIACGGREYVTADMVDAAVGQMGIMSYIYGLHLLNAGAPSELWSADKLAEQLLALRKEDGGWAVNGNYSDADVTAMCLQALACYDGSAYQAEVADAIESGLGFLSGAQKLSGGYASYGVENCESACQVLIALSSLGIDASADERFIKNGNTIAEAILAHRLPDGSFAHQLGGDANATATVQALAAFASIEAASPLYALRDVDAQSIDASALVALQAELGWKLWAYAAILLLTIIGVILMLAKRHGRAKRLLSTVLVCLLLAAAVTMIDIQPTSSYYTPQTVADPAGTVSLAIRCDTVAGRGTNGVTPEDGVILPACDVPFAEGETVLDALLRAAKEHHLQLEHSGATAGMAYVNGIANLYEFDLGSQSGWMYSVNGVFPSVGCESCVLKDGDVVLWQYTLSNGEDLK